MPRISAQALYSACLYDGDAAAVSRLLPADGTRLNLSGPSFQTPDDNKWTPLIAAATHGHTEIVRTIRERAPNTAVDYVDANGATALLAAAHYHHADILRLLTDRRANVNVEAGQQRNTPLRLAVGPLHADTPPRGPDPDGARQLSTVKALLLLGAGTLPLGPLSPSDLAAQAQPFCTQLSRLEIRVLTTRVGADPPN
jgi:ankyrin repeat protein